MKIQLGRDQQVIQTDKRVKVQIGENKYYLTESIDGKLNINKISEGDTDAIMVFPRVSNEIEIL